MLPVRLDHLPFLQPPVQLLHFNKQTGGQVCFVCPDMNTGKQLMKGLEIG